MKVKKSIVKSIYKKSSVYNYLLYKSALEFLICLAQILPMYLLVSTIYVQKNIGFFGEKKKPKLDDFNQKWHINPNFPDIDTPFLTVISSRSCVENSLTKALILNRSKSLK